MKNKKMGIIIALIAIGIGIVLYSLFWRSGTAKEDGESGTAALSGVCSAQAAEGGCAGEEYETEDHEDPRVKEFEISPGIVVQKIEEKQDIVLLDVRTPEEYEEVHLKNSLLVPVQELSQKTLNDAGLSKSAKDEEIIIYCRSGNRSTQAYEIMQSLGYTNIKSIAGGMIHWQEDRYPFTEVGAYKGGREVGVVVDNSTDQVAAPAISLDKKKHDFGVVARAAGIVTTTFVVRNTGTDTLEIGDLSTSCSCTSAKLDSRVIAPGETAVLTVSFDPDFHKEPSGVLERTVFIPTNDPNMPEAEVTISVEIEG